MKNLNLIKGFIPLSKKEQKNICGGKTIVAQNCPGVGGAACPDYCHCEGESCVFNYDHPRAGQFCYAL